MIPIVGFYTEKTPYEKEAQELIANAQSFNLVPLVHKVPSRGNWEANCQIKAEVLAQTADQLSVPFLYVDVDARFAKYPVLFDYQLHKDYDIGLHFFRGSELLSGTIWINPTIETKGTLEEWRLSNLERPKEWDQRNLQHIINKSPKLRILRLPCEYAFIHDLSERHYGACDPVIVHYQASRKYKRRV